MFFLLLSIPIAIASALLLFAAWRSHKKAFAGPLQIMGQSAFAVTELAPEGAVLIGGEIYRARSKEGTFSPVNSRVRIVGATGHLLEVETET